MGIPCIFPFAFRFRFKCRIAVLKLSNLKIREDRWRNTVVLPSGEFHGSNFPRALSRFPVHDRVLGHCIVAAPADDAPRFGLCALRSRISRYTYATRDLLPMIMRGWKYALQEDEEEEMGPRPRLSNGRYRLTWPRRRPRCIPPIDAKHGALPARWREDKLAPVAIFMSVDRSLSLSLSFCRSARRPQTIEKLGTRERRIYTIIFNILFLGFFPSTLQRNFAEGRYSWCIFMEKYDYSSF